MKADLQRKQEQTLTTEQDAARLKSPRVQVVSSWKGRTYGCARRTGMAMAAAVLLPTLVAAVYFFFIAAGQYQSEAHISVRAAHGANATSALFGVVMGASDMSQSTQDVRSLVEYIRSRSAARALDERIGLRAIFSHPAADALSRMPRDADFETLYKSYTDHVDVLFDAESGAAIIHTRAFTPQDAHLIASSIMTLSEELINGLNSRSERDALRLAEENVGKAEQRIRDVKGKLVEFRLENEDIDPTMKSGAISGIIASLDAEYARLSAELKAMSTYMTPENIQVIQARKKLAALQEQIAQEQKRLTGKGNAYTQKIAEYETLMIEQDIATQAYTSALVSLENARAEAQRQKSYVVPVVEPIIAETAEYPRRARSVFLVFIVSFMVFAIARLVYAGIRDHVIH